MIGSRIYPKKSRTLFFLGMYGLLALGGGLLLAQAYAGGSSPSGAAGFMLIFGAGMFVLTAVKSRQPQILVHEEYLEVRQSRMPVLIRYRNLVSVSRLDRTKMVLRLWEDGDRKEVAVWLKELDGADIERLADFLSLKSRKPRQNS
ncbi:MAG: hypothetical protein OHK006_14420 [Thermodesulfovibrionales bacterium]